MAPGRLIEDVGEVFGAHDRSGKREDGAFAQELGDDLAGEGFEARVVHNDGVAARDVDLGFGVVGPGDPLGDAREAFDHQGTGFIGEGTHSSRELNGVGDDVMGRPAVELGDGQDTLGRWREFVE